MASREEWPGNHSQSPCRLQFHIFALHSILTGGGRWRSACSPAAPAATQQRVIRGKISVEVLEHGRQGGSVSYLVQLLGRKAQNGRAKCWRELQLFGPDELEQKNKAQRATHLSEPNFLSAPEDPGTEIGARPLLTLFNFFIKKQLKLHKKKSLAAKSCYL